MLVELPTVKVFQSTRTVKNVAINTDHIMWIGYPNSMDEGDSFIHMSNDKDVEIAMTYHELLFKLNNMHPIDNNASTQVDK